MKFRKRLAPLALLAVWVGCGGDDFDGDRYAQESTSGNESAAFEPSPSHQAPHPGSNVSSSEAATGSDSTSPPGACEGQVLFNTDSADLSPEARAKLEQLARCVRNREIEEVTLVGHADPRGTDEYNHDLGMRRAAAVGQVFEQHGLGDADIEIRSRGEQAASEVRMRWPSDRRVEVDVAAPTPEGIPSGGEE